MQRGSSHVLTSLFGGPLVTRENSINPRAVQQLQEQVAAQQELKRKRELAAQKVGAKTGRDKPTAPAATKPKASGVLADLDEFDDLLPGGGVRRPSAVLKPSSKPAAAAATSITSKGSVAARSTPSSAAGSVSGGQRLPSSHASTIGLSKARPGGPTTGGQTTGRPAMGGQTAGRPTMGEQTAGRPTTGFNKSSSIGSRPQASVTAAGGAFRAASSGSSIGAKGPPSSSVRPSPVSAAATGSKVTAAAAGGAGKEGSSGLFATAGGRPSATGAGSRTGGALVPPQGRLTSGNGGGQVLSKPPLSAGALKGTSLSSRDHSGAQSLGQSARPAAVASGNGRPLSLSERMQQQRQQQQQQQQQQAQQQRSAATPLTGGSGGVGGAYKQLGGMFSLSVGGKGRDAGAPGSGKKRAREDEWEEDDFIDDGDDGGGGEQDWRRELRRTTGYDPRRYRYEVDDTRTMEAGYHDVLAEEARSARVARLEEEKQVEEEKAYREEKERRRRKQLQLKKQRRHGSSSPLSD